MEDVATQLASYTSINVYRGSSSNPDTATFLTLVTTITLVSGTLSYSFTDTSGTVSTLWRCSYYNTSTVAESGLGPVIKAGATLASFRPDCARAARAGSSSTCTAAGTVTTLIDASLGMSGVDSYYHEGDWLYRSAAAAGDRLRRVGEAGFGATTGTLTIPLVYPWTTPPALAEGYDLYSLLPPIEVGGESYSWNDAIRDGLRDLWYLDQINLGAGGTIGQTRYSLQQFGDVVTRESVRAVFFRRTDSNGVIRDYLMGTNGTYWTVQENDTDGLTLILSDSPSTTETLIVNIKRRFALPYIDTDVMTGPLSLATAATCRQVFWKLEGPGGSRYNEWNTRYLQEYRTYGAPAAVLV